MKLYKHQQEIIDEDPKKAGLFLGTGSGKTKIALMLARGSVLVIAPKTQVEDQNWEREKEKSKIEYLKGEDGLKNIIKKPLTVMTFDIFKRDHATLPRFDTVIVDEAHGMLGVTPNTRMRKKVEIPKASQRFEALDKYLEHTKPDRLYLCTATIMKSPMTVWAAAKILMAPAFPPNFYNWRNDFYTRLPMPGREVWVAKSDSSTKDKLAAWVKAIGHTGRLQDFFDVPEQTFKTEYIELTEKQKKRIKGLALEYPEPIVRIGKRHQVENGVLKGDEFTDGEHLSNGKIDRIVELAAEFTRMVVFARYKMQIEEIVLALRDEYPKKDIFAMTGDTDDRGELIQLANKSEDCVFIAQAQISAGWELPEYPVMVFASRTYSWVDYDQALGRIQRANNIKKNLYINLVVRGGIDEAVDKSLTNKQDFNERLYAGV